MLDSNSRNTQLLDPSVLLIRAKIRSGENPNNPELISLWLIQENIIQESVGCLTLRRQHCEDQFRLLLDAVVDEMLPKHWRHHCLNNIHQPLASLRKISSGEKSEKRLRQLLSELSISCRYVAATL